MRFSQRETTKPPGRASSEETYRMEQGQLPVLNLQESAPESWIAGERLLEDVFDLIRRRLSGLACDDPVRFQLGAVLPSVGRHLGRPALMQVPPERSVAP